MLLVNPKDRVRLSQLKHIPWVSEAPDLIPPFPEYPESPRLQNEEIHFDGTIIEEQAIICDDDFSFASIARPAKLVPKAYPS
jgi:hypothetical protein